MKHITIAFLAVTLLAVVVTSNECPNVCPMIYGPVCGSNAAGNKKTFDNMCLYNVHNCNLKRDGLPMLTTVTQGACV